MQQMTKSANRLAAIGYSFDFDVASLSSFFF
jgi:hypothetical protein